MGIKNRDGALFMATGIDNSGLYEGKREAMGIIKTLASEVDRKSTRLNSSHQPQSRMPSSA